MTNGTINMIITSSPPRFLSPSWMLTLRNGTLMPPVSDKNPSFFAPRNSRPPSNCDNPIDATVRISRELFWKRRITSTSISAPFTRPPTTARGNIAQYERPCSL